MRGQKGGRLGFKVSASDSGRFTGSFRAGEVAEAKLLGRGWPEPYGAQAGAVKGGVIVSSPGHISVIGNIYVQSGELQ